MISPYISPLNIKKLNLSADKKYVLPGGQKKRRYLAYHTKNIFKK